MANVRQHPRLDTRDDRMVNYNIQGYVRQLALIASDTLQGKGAQSLWKEFHDAYVPGIRYSDRPRHLWIPRHVEDAGGERVVPELVNLLGLERDETQWDAIPHYLNRLPKGMHYELPEGWTYAGIVPDHVHSVHDEPNPRAYDVSGRPLLQAWVGSLGLSDLKRQFEWRLADLYMNTPPNFRRVVIHERLDHHHANGGNPEAFRLYVAEIIDHWNGENPPVFPGLTESRGVPVRTTRLLGIYIQHLMEWAPKSKNENAESGPARDLKTSLQAIWEPFVDALTMAELVKGRTWIGGEDKKFWMVAAYYTAIGSVWPELNIKPVSQRQLGMMLFDAFEGMRRGKTREYNVSQAKGNSSYHNACDQMKKYLVRAKAKRNQ